MASELIKLVADSRKGWSDVCIFAPVGDAIQLKVFLKQIERLNLDKRQVDFLFIFRNLDDIIKTDLSAMYYVETCAIGTSGCFFAGQKILYEMGYKVIISTDLDAELDSSETFDTMVAFAKMKKIAVFSRSIFNENTSKQLAYNVNDWAFYPREFFDEVGFSTPYMWRGGEEYELLTRIHKLHPDKFMVHSGGYTHPFVGFSIYHKLIERGKYYPYVSGILRAILFVSGYDRLATVKFITWYMFYGFFADMLDDKSLKKVLSTSGRFELLREVKDSEQWFSIEKIKESGHFSNTSITRVAYLPLSFISLLLFKKYELYTDEVTLLVSRKKLLFGLLKAIFMMPLRKLQAISRHMEWKRIKIAFPPKPDNSDIVQETYHNIIEKGEIYA